MEMAAREMTHDEWAEQLVGQNQAALALALATAEARGRRHGRASLEGALHHFEVAYRYAVNSHRTGADKADLLASAETFAKIAYDAMRKDR